jgi:PAS domain S-box-containing protein
MTGIPSSESKWFEAFLKSAQYLVRLQLQQDIWEHLGKFVLAHFSAQWLAFVERGAGNRLSLRYCTLPGKNAGEKLLTSDVRGVIADVLESGFLASRVLKIPTPSMTVFLPIVENSQTNRVMLIGHEDDQPLPNELLNIYLALAGLAGATTERKRAEEEVRRLNEELELRVAQRTVQLQSANDELVTEILERKLIEEALRQNRERLRVTLASIGDAVLSTNTNGQVTFLNPIAAALTGWSPEEALGQPIESVFPIVNEQTRASAEDIVTRVLQEGRTVEHADQTLLLTKDGREIPIEDSAAPILDGSGTAVGVVLVFHDVTERRRTQQERDTTIEFLRLVNESTGTRELVRTAVTFFQEQSGCHAVGIRLSEGEDYPYFEARGFPKEFVELENSLCSRDAAGNVIRDGTGNPVIECMCGSVICGRIDPAQPFFTPNGSFWTNSTTRLLANTGERDRQARTRNRCNGEGYESVALIPLRIGEQRLGLLQLNDRRPGAFSPQVMDVWERLAGHLAVALAKFRAEEELKQNRAKLEAALASMSDAVFISDAAGHFLDFNDAFATFHRFRNKAECARTFGAYPDFLEVFLPSGELAPLDMWAVPRALRGETVTSAEYTLRRKDTGESWVGSYSFSPIRDKDGTIVGAVVVGRDITDRKRAEEALLRSEKLASVGRMAASIAHEINNPLEAVTNLLFLAKTSHDQPEATYQYLDMADEELRRIAHITRQSLGFYRESNAPTRVSVDAVLESAVDLLKSRITAKHAVIEKQWNGAVMITAVAGELRQVFSNLLANSLDAVDECGTIKLRLSTCTAARNGHSCVRVTVADNGKGIGEGSRPKLFEPFFTTKGTVGTGLGLWVIKQIVDKHGGTIQVRSSVGGKRRGTVFSIVLPVEPLQYPCDGK